MIEEKTVDSLNEYIQFIECCSLEYSLSRGQSEDVPLLPGALRKNSSGNRLYSKMDIKKFLTDFKSESVYYLDNAISNTNDNDNLVYAQHYGLPTYLLDFTYSHIISLAFAVENIFNQKDSSIDKHAVVWFVNPEQINLISFQTAQVLNISQVSTESFDKPIFISCNKIHSRIKSQNGLFLYFNENSLAFEEYEEYHSHIKKVLIPWDKCKKILCDLYKLGIRHSALYPELPTVAKDILLKNQVIEFCKEATIDE